MNDQLNQEETNVEPTDLPEEELKMPESYTEAEEPHSQLGIVLGILIVILVLILGGLYLWGTTLNPMNDDAATSATRPTAADNNEPESNNAEADVSALKTVSTSDEIDAIEADIEATNLDEIDTELNAIDAEIDAALAQ